MSFSGEFSPLSNDTMEFSPPASSVESAASEKPAVLSLAKSCIDHLDDLRSVFVSAPLGDRRAEQAYLSEALRSLSSLDMCFWCKYGRYASDCAQFLLTLPPENPYTSWFKQATTACLRRCRACVFQYYQECERIVDELDGAGRKAVEKALEQFDVERIVYPMKEFIEGRMEHKNVALIFAIFEVLSFAPWMEHDKVGSLFALVMETLIKGKRSLKITELLPGLLCALLSKNRMVKEWAYTRLSAGQLASAAPFAYRSFDYSKAMVSALDSHQSSLQLLYFTLYTPREYLRISEHLLCRLMALLEKDINHLKLIMHYLTLDKRGELITLERVDSMVKAFVTSSIYSIKAQPTFEATRPTNWLAARDESVCLYFMCFLFEWIDRQKIAGTVLRSHLTKWIGFNPNMHISILLAICSNIDILSTCTINLHHIAGSLYKKLESSRSLFSNCRIDILRTSVRNLINVSVVSMHARKIEPQFCSFLNLYIAHILGFSILTAPDVFGILTSVGEIASKEEGALMNVDFVHELAIRMRLDKDSINLNDWPLLACLIIYDEQSAAIELVKVSHDLLISILSRAWSSKMSSLLINFLRCRPFHDFLAGLESGRPLHKHLLKFLSIHHEPSGPYYSILEKVLVKHKSGDFSAGSAGFEESRSAMCCLLKNVCMSIKLNANSTGASVCFVEIVELFIKHQIEAPREVVNSFEVLKGSAWIAPSMRNAIAAYESTFKKDKGYSKTNATSKVTFLAKEEAPRMAHSKRDIDALKSKVVPILSKPQTKLGSIKSEMIKSVPLLPNTAQRKAKRAPIDPAISAAHPIHPKRIAHSGVRAESIVLSDDDENDMNEVKDALKAKAQTDTAESRSVKMVEISASGQVIDPEVARLMPKRSASGPARESNFWHRLQRHVLSIDYNKISPEHLDNTLPREKSQIPTFFRNYKEYEAVFEPLLFMEAEAQIVQAKEELISGPDHFFDQVLLTVLAISMVDNFHEVEFGADEKMCRAFCELDLVVVNGETDKDFPSTSLLGIVISSHVRRGQAVISLRFFFSQTSQIPLQLSMRQGVRWKARSLCSLVTCTREHQALSHLPHFDAITGHVLIPQYNEELVKNQEMELFTSGLVAALSLNRPQSYAVASALLDPNPFTLIQGPPGTGKTKVIESIATLAFSNLLPNSLFPRYKRILLCAPSNAAVDEIARRLKHMETARLLRIGSAEMIDAGVKEISLDYLIEEHMSAIMKAHNERLDEQRAICNDLDAQLKVAERTRVGDVQEIKRKIWNSRETSRKLIREVEDARNSARCKILEEANIVCCTLSGSGHEMISRLHGAQKPFEFVVIDEACQAVELSTLIPLQWGAKKCVLVGDPNQLPPTIISQAAINGSYEQSLFKRLQKANPERVLLLSVQYRMHPDICSFPSSYYYQGRLVNGPGMAIETGRPWHSIGALGTYRFFDMPGLEERRVLSGGQTAKSAMNVVEAEMAVMLVAFLCNQFPTYNFRQKIGIITPYNEQRKKIQRELMKRFGNDSHTLRRVIEVSTVDSFQGQEREIIIFSCVRTGQSSGLGFLNDARRLNVALTRARASLYIMGSAETLRRNKLWGALVDDARQRGVLVPYDDDVWKEMQLTCDSGIGRIPNNLI